MTAAGRPSPLPPSGIGPDATEGEYHGHQDRKPHFQGRRLNGRRVRHAAGQRLITVLPTANKSHDDALTINKRIRFGIGAGRYAIAMLRVGRRMYTAAIVRRDWQTAKSYELLSSVGKRIRWMIRLRNRRCFHVNMETSHQTDHRHITTSHDGNIMTLRAVRCVFQLSLVAGGP